MSLQARYTILRKIADGGTAEIFLATQNGVHGFEKVVVLKRIFPAYYADPQFRDMLVNEAHIAMSFNHSNIVQVLDLGEDDGQYILALELVDGWTLDAVMRRVRAVRSSIQPALALYVTAEVCRALAYAHAKTGGDSAPLGIVHRDISPHNVLLSEQGEVKLTDFGIATARNQSNQGTEKVIKGKIAYMSPEQAAGATLDARSDLFSVGTMLYVMVCGRYPFDAPTDLEVLLLVKNGEAVPPEVARPGIHPELSRLLKRALAKDPAERYQRADDMLVEVEQVMRSAFRAVGQTELKRWLQDLSTRDGVPTLTKAPALPSSLSAGRVVGASPATQTAPTKIPPPPSPARSGSTPIRPAPPPAALSVGRKTAASSAAGGPPRPPRSLTPPMHDAPAGDPAAPEAASGRNPSEPLSGTTTATPPKPVDTGSSTRVSRPSSPGLPTLTTPPLTPASSRATPASGLPPLGAHTPLPSPSPRVTLAARPVAPTSGTGERPAIPIPIPPTFSSAASLVPPPPVSPEILASLAASGPKSMAPSSGATADAATQAGNSGSHFSAGWLGTPKRRLALVGAGLGGLVLLVVSLKTCGTKRPVDQSPSAPSVAVVQPVADAGGAPPAKASQATNVVNAPDAAVTPQLGGGEPTGGAGGATATAEATAAGGATVALAPAPGETATEAAKTAEHLDAALATADAGSGAPPPAVATGAAPTTPPSPPPDAASDVVPTGVAAETDTTHGDGNGESQANDGSTDIKSVRVNVTLQSTPTGARVSTAHHNYGPTPTVIHLRSGNVYALTFNHDGFRPYTTRVEITTAPEQEINVTLRKAPASAPVKAAPAATPAPPPPPPPPPPKHDKSWWQQMFKR